MSATRTYMPLTIAMRQEMAASDALATYEDYQARLVEISAAIAALLAVPYEDRDAANARAVRMHREDRQAIHRHVNNLYTAHAVRVALSEGHALEAASEDPDNNEGDI